MCDNASRPATPYERDMMNAKIASQPMTMAVDMDYGQAQAGIGSTQGYAKLNRPSPLEELEKAQARDTQDLERRHGGIEFLRAHPQFNEFIALIRSGSIAI